MKTYEKFSFREILIYTKGKTMRKVLYLSLIVIFAILLGACNREADTVSAAISPVGGVEAAACAVNEYPVFAYPDVTEDDWVIGPEDASVTIISYSDYQCPYCSLMDPEVMALYEAHPDDTRVVFRHFPLSYHEHALSAAVTAEYVGDQLGDEAFFEYTDMVFASQGTWESMTEDEFKSYLKDLLETEFDLVPADFDAVLADETYNANVNDDYTLGTAFVTGTPFILINGIPLMYMPVEVASFEDAYNFAVDFPTTQWDTCPEMIVERDKQYFATVETSKGSFVMELFPDSAPTTVNSFITLANDGYFDGVKFHRVVSGFVAQTGDPTGTGVFGPGYEFGNEIDPSLNYTIPGIVGMANSGADTNGSQFFITYDAQPALDGGYTIFGYVVEGMDVVESLQVIDPQNPVEGEVADTIISITISEE